MSTRRSPPYQMFQQLGRDNPSPMRLASLSAFGGQTDDDIVKLMEVRLDNYLDDLPASEELKINTGRRPYYSKRFLRRFVIGVATTLVLVTVLVLIVDFAKRQPRRNGSSAATKAGEPSSKRVQDVISFLLDDVDHEALSNTSSPQYLAAKWIADEDPRLAVMDGDRGFHQRYALAVLWFAMGGTGWHHDLDFLSSQHECDWNTPFQHMDRSLQPMGALCNNHKKVTSLRLQTIGLVGSVPSELKLIADLDSLELDRNQLTNMDGVRELTQVRKLTLGYNKLSQDIPDWFGELDQLQILGLSDNEFTSTIPPAWTNMTKLTTLLLDNNKLSGQVSTLNNITSLRELFLEGNYFTGEITNGFLQDLHSLEVLDLSNNYLEGHLSRALLRKPNLKYLDLNHNSLEGAMPTDIPHTTTLTSLTLHHNFFEGDVPSTIRNLKNLRRLDISHNRLDGTLPDSLRELTNLEYLFLAGNNHIMPGPLPKFVRPLSNLKELSFASSARTGIIPHWIGSLTNLALLDLGSNRFNSTIPALIGHLTNMEYLLLNRNELTGPIPRELGHLHKLKLLLLDQNSLTGSVDEATVCALKPPILMADCDETPCSCCSKCCHDIEGTNDLDAGNSCSDSTILTNYDPMWENQFQRPAFNYTADVVIFSGAASQINP